MCQLFFLFLLAQVGMSLLAIESICIWLSLRPERALSTCVYINTGGIDLQENLTVCMQDLGNNSKSVIVGNSNCPCVEWRLKPVARFQKCTHIFFLFDEETYFMSSTANLSAVLLITNFSVNVQVYNFNPEIFIHLF